MILATLLRLKNFLSQLQCIFERWNFLPLGVRYGLRFRYITSINDKQLRRLCYLVPRVAAEPLSYCRTHCSYFYSGGSYYRREVSDQAK